VSKRERIHTRLLATAAELSPPLAAAIAATGPLSVPRRAPGVALEDRLFRAVAGQQLSVKAAATIWARVEASAGRRRLVNHLAEVDPAALRACGLSGAKARSMRAIAEAARAGELDPDDLRSLDHTQRSLRLTAIWGVGQWTADMIGLFYFADPDIWPEGDVTARKTLRHLTSPRRKTTLSAARFAPARSYLALHMWRCADSTPA